MSEETASPTVPPASRPAQVELSRLSLLYDVSRSFNELIDLDQLILEVIAKTKELLHAESCAILLLDEQRHELYFPYSSDVDREVERRFSGVRVPIDRSVAGWVLQHGSPQLVPDVSKDERWYGHVDRHTGMETYSLLCAPLCTRRGKLGVIEVRNKRQGSFSQEDLDFLHALGGSIAVAIDNARLYQELKASEARLRDQVVGLNREVLSLRRFDDIVGTSAVMQRVFQLMESAISTPVTVLLQGETGTGKELIARAIHYNGARATQPFVAVNCGALSESLLASELFGHKKGAFTDAVKDRKGLFEVANGGTIFLDEVGEMALAMQVNLLRVLEDGEVLPVGDTKPHHVDVRVISATNLDLERETKEGRFRRDLFYRLSAFPIHVPPLRERRDDILPLTNHILQRVTQKFHKPIASLSSAAMDALTDYQWPGNVRELENEIERAVALAPVDGVIQPDQLSEKLAAKRPVRVPPGAQATSLKLARELYEKEYLAEILRQNGGNASRTAKVLSISRVMLQKKIKDYGLRVRTGAALSTRANK